MPFTSENKLTIFSVSEKADAYPLWLGAIDTTSNLIRGDSPEKAAASDNNRIDIIDPKEKIDVTNKDPKNN